jgi:hypothetical protein
VTRLIGPDHFSEGIREMGERIARLVAERDALRRETRAASAAMAVIQGGYGCPEFDEYRRIRAENEAAGLPRPEGETP